MSARTGYGKCRAENFTLLQTGIDVSYFVACIDVIWDVDKGRVSRGLQWPHVRSSESFSARGVLELLTRLFSATGWEPMHLNLRKSFSSFSNYLDSAWHAKILSSYLLKLPLQVNRGSPARLFTDHHLSAHNWVLDEPRREAERILTPHTKICRCPTSVSRVS